MKEVWRISPSVGNIIVSSYGRVMIIPYMAEMPHGAIRHYETFPRYGEIHEKNGNRPIIVYRGKSYKISQLVCEAFNGKKPFNKAVVMHIDDDPTNNKAENLKWGTQKENLNSEKFISFCRSRTGERSTYTIGVRRKQEKITQQTKREVNE